MFDAFITLGTRGFSRVRSEFSVLAEGRHIFGAGHYKDLTETGNRARKFSGTQGMLSSFRPIKKAQARCNAIRD